MSLVSARSVTILLGISACGMMGYFLYTLLKDRDDEYLDTVPTSSSYKRHEVCVPKNAVRVIIGRNGKEIRRLQELSNTKINIRCATVEEEDFRVLVIRGTSEGCRMAEDLIQELVFNQSLVESTDMWVPNASVGRIIGRCGENITEITSASGAKVTVCDEKANNPNTRVVIKGTKDQIAMAQALIQRTIEKTALSKSFIDSSLAKREPRLPPKSLEISKATARKPKVEDISSPDILGPPDNQFEVYVSAMIDPSHFWLQIVGPKATELDQLVEEMSEYYNREENRETHALVSVQKGDLVAAIFQYDDKWYRAEVLEVQPADLRAELYYVDYGDTDNVPVKELYELRTDFLRLHFQAIECYLAGVEPVGDAWTEEAIDKFEEWTHVAQWKKLSAKVNGYSVREKTRAKREGSPVPGVDLFDVSNDKDFDIARELVDGGYAIFKKDGDTRLLSSSRTTSHGSVNSIS